MSIIISIMLLIAGFYFVTQWLKDDRDVTAIKAIILLTASMFVIVLSTAIKPADKVDDIYYVPVTVDDYIAGDTGDITIFVDDNNKKYRSEGHYEYDNVYMLTVASNETRNTRDDTVLVVWLPCYPSLG